MGEVLRLFLPPIKSIHSVSSSKVIQKLIYSFTRSVRQEGADEAFVVGGALLRGHQTMVVSQQGRASERKPNETAAAKE